MVLLFPLEYDLTRMIYRDYFMENARVQFLFTSCVVSENERVSAANE